MEEKQLPKEVENAIIKEAYLKFNYPSEGAQREAYREGATAYASKLHQANEVIKVLEYDNNRLKGEVEGLNRWKEEAKAIINPIWEYADTLKVPLGESKTDAVIKHINEAKNLLNEVLVMNEAWGDLPGEFINKVKTFLYGE